MSTNTKPYIESVLTGVITSHTHPAGTSSGDMTKAVYDSDENGIIEAAQLNLSSKAGTTHVHVTTDITGTAVATNDARLSDSRTPLAHTHISTEITGTAVLTADSRLSDSRTPLAHAHVSTDTTGTAVLTADSRLSDARTPLAHVHISTDMTGTAVLTADSRLSDARTPVAHDNTKHTASYITQANAVIPNGTITGAQNTKITYDAKGLVTSGTAAVASDVGAESSGAVATHSALTTGIHGATSTATANRIPISDANTFINQAWLGSGASATNFLRGDQTWQTISAGGESEQIVIKGSDTANPGTAYADATGLSFVATANKEYIVEGWIRYATNATTVGAKFSCNGPTTPGFVCSVFNVALVTSGMSGGGGSTYNSGVAAASAFSTTDNLAMLNILFNNGTTGGTFSVRFAAETTGTITVKSGSLIRYRQVN